MTGDAPRLGLYGFGASAHLVIQVARHEGRRVFAFVRAGDEAARRFALELGAEWAGDSSGPSPEELDAAILFAPAGELVPVALSAVAKGGTVVCAGIHMSDIPSFPYRILWGERVLRSVANLTRADGEAFMALAPQVPVRTEVESFPLEGANEALDRLRSGRVRGAAVLVVGQETARGLVASEPAQVLHDADGEQDRHGGHAGETDHVQNRKPDPVEPEIETRSCRQQRVHDEQHDPRFGGSDVAVSEPEDPEDVRLQVHVDREHEITDHDRESHREQHEG
jgi:hypothetical protein